MIEVGNVYMNKLAALKFHKPINAENVSDRTC